jgi:hypothetical protein
MRFAGHRAGALRIPHHRVCGGDGLGRVARNTLVPSLPHTRDEGSTLATILGTAIGPYLFFRHASQKVEIEKAAAQSTQPSIRIPRAGQFGTVLAVSELFSIRAVLNSRTNLQTYNLKCRDDVHPFTPSEGWTIEDEQCQKIGAGYTAVKFRFLLFLRMEPILYADPESNVMKAERSQRRALASCKEPWI